MQNMEAELNEEALWLSYLIKKYGNPVTNPKDFYNRVVEDYEHWDQELSGEHFNFPVKMIKSDIINAYSECQHTINSDTISRKRGRHTYLYGGTGFIDRGEYTDIYEGSARDFLMSLNNNGFSRWVDEDEEVDFIL